MNYMMNKIRRQPMRVTRGCDGINTTGITTIRARINLLLKGASDNLRICMYLPQSKRRFGEESLRGHEHV